ncbi:MAG: RNA-processing protein [Candidatus Aenigmarchaeota archaeon]|nr:RNA-processing protein [Candidatus Aenigmarchaeota archaeon]
MVRVIEFVKLPDERKAVVIGKNAAVKKGIEEATDTEITVDDDVKVEGENAVGVMDAKNIITAIGRGFPPEKALKLSNSDNMLEIISLKDYSPKKRMTQKSRVIGTKGRTRKLIEEFTGCDLSVYGDTVSIIGEWEKANIAKQAVEQILAGRSHAAVYKFLEKNSPGREISL